MKLKNIRMLGKKPLADFYNGECFLFYDQVTDEDHLLMAAGEAGIMNDTCFRKVIDLDTGEVDDMLDCYMYEQVIVDIEEIGK